jgi:hypothetical protein
MGNSKRFPAGAVLLVLLASMLRGQSTSARIIGNVKGAEGEYLTGVTVTAVNVTTNAAMTVMTDKKEGAFRLLGLAPGIYQVSFDLSGYQSYVASGIRLYAEQSFLLRIQLDRIGIKKNIATAAESLADAPDRPRGAPIIGVKAGVNLSLLSIRTGRDISHFVYWTPGTDPWHGGLSWQFGFTIAFPIGRSVQFSPELLLASYRSHLKGDFDGLEVSWTLARTQLQVPLLFKWQTSSWIAGGQLFFLLGPQIVFNLGSDLKLSVDGSETETDITDKYVRSDFCFIGGFGVKKPVSSGKTCLTVELRFCLSVTNQSAAALSKHKQNAMMLLTGISF